jgi:hypothetical protein
MQLEACSTHVVLVHVTQASSDQFHFTVGADNHNGLQHRVGCLAQCQSDASQAPSLMAICLLWPLR